MASRPRGLADEAEGGKHCTATENGGRSGDRQEGGDDSSVATCDTQLNIMSLIGKISVEVTKGAHPRRRIWRLRRLPAIPEISGRRDIPGTARSHRHCRSNPHRRASRKACESRRNLLPPKLNRQPDRSDLSQ